MSDYPIVRVYDGIFDEENGVIVMIDYNGHDGRTIRKMLEKTVCKLNDSIARLVKEGN